MQTTANPLPSYELEVIQDETGKAIEFKNNSQDYVEVVFLIDGKETKYGKTVTPGYRGYGFEPESRRTLTKMKDGKPLYFGASGTVTALVYAGEGRLKDETLETPTFIRRRLGAKISFKRYSDIPIATFEVSY